MKYLSLLTLVFCAVWAAPSFAIESEQPATPKPAGQERTKVFDAESFTLDNGMQIVVIPNTRAPVITHMVWYKVGAADENMGKSGIAHFMEHLMFKGSSQIGGPDLKPGEFSQIIRGLGGNDNAFTGQDYTAYFQSIASEHLEKVMRMEAGRMRGMKPPLSEVESERKVILEERRQRTDNDPRGRFQEQLSAAAYVNHPYGLPVIGWYHEMEKLSWDDAKAFYDRWYAPNNAILVVSGDVTPGEVFAKAIDIYGSIPKRAVPKRERPQSPTLNSETTVTLKHPVIRQPTVQTLFRVPSARQNKSQSLALELLSEIMAGGSTSRLYKSLVVKQKIASGAGLSYNGSSWDDASVWLYATPVEGQSLETVQSALLEELSLLVEKGVKEDELKDAKSRLQDSAIYARDSLTGPAMIIGRALANGSTLDDVEYWPYDLENVSAEDIQAVAREFLNPDTPSQYPPVSGYLLPQEDKK